MGVSRAEMWESAVHLIGNITDQDAELRVEEAGEPCTGMVAFGVEVPASRETGRHIGARRSTRRRRGLLPPGQFIVYVRRELVELKE